MFNFTVNAEDLVLVIGLAATFFLSVFAFFTIGKENYFEEYWGRKESVSEYTAESLGFCEERNEETL